MAKLTASERYSSRKFIVTVGAMLLAFTLALIGKLSGEFATIAAVCVGAYNLANSFTTKKEQPDE
jgi:hypothetical protein